MSFISPTPMLLRYLWQIKTVVFLHWCIIHAAPLGGLGNLNHKHLTRDKHSSLFSSKVTTKKFCDIDTSHKTFFFFVNN